MAAQQPSSPKEHAATALYALPGAMEGTRASFRASAPPHGATLPPRSPSHRDRAP